MKLIATVVIRTIALIQKYLIMPVGQWCARRINPEIAAIVGTPYVEADGRVNPLVVMSALEDHKQWLADSPEDCQSVLNACMESLRAESLHTTFVGMLGELTARYSLEEAMIRVLANAVLLGMLIEKRAGVIRDVPQQSV